MVRQLTCRLALPRRPGRSSFTFTLNVLVARFLAVRCLAEMLNQTQNARSDAQSDIWPGDEKHSVIWLLCFAVVDRGFGKRLFAFSALA